MNDDFASRKTVELAKLPMTSLAKPSQVFLAETMEVMGTKI